MLDAGAAVAGMLAPAAGAGGAADGAGGAVGVQDASNSRGIATPYRPNVINLLITILLYFVGLLLTSCKTNNMVYGGLRPLEVLNLTTITILNGKE